MYLSTDKWLNQIWCVYTMEFKWAISKIEVMPFARRYNWRYIFLLSKVIQTKKVKFACFLSFVDSGYCRDIKTWHGEQHCLGGGRWWVGREEVDIEYSNSTSTALEWNCICESITIFSVYMPIKYLKHKNMDIENAVYMQNGISFIHKEWNYVDCIKMD